MNLPDPKLVYSLVDVLPHVPAAEAGAAARRLEAELRTSLTQTRGRGGPHRRRAEAASLAVVALDQAATYYMHEANNRRAPADLLHNAGLNAIEYAMAYARLHK
jgi:hypothetical protein